jgi:hypothetical protein
MTAGIVVRSVLLAILITGAAWIVIGAAFGYFGVAAPLPR